MKTGRNDPCPCGSGKKYKKCCLDLDRQAGRAGGAPLSKPGGVRKAVNHQFTGLKRWSGQHPGATIDLRPDPTDSGNHPPLRPGGPEGPGAEPEAAFPQTEHFAPGDMPADVERAFANSDRLAIVGRFALHLAAISGFGPRTVKKHAANARLFVRFLIATEVPCRAVHEYDVRWFLYFWLPCHDVAGKTHAEAMPVSLGHFFAFLDEEEAIVYPWASAILGDRETFRFHLENAPDPLTHDSNIDRVRAGLNVELAELLLLPERKLGEGYFWGPSMGYSEARLQRELHRRWLIWRDELIRDGIDDWDEVADELARRQKEWELTPHPDLGGDTPLQAVLRERAEREERLARN
jgi:hypothetical protein